MSAGCLWLCSFWPQVMVMAYGLHMAARYGASLWLSMLRRRAALAHAKAPLGCAQRPSRETVLRCVLWQH